MDYKEILKGIVDIINTTEKSDIGFANICTYIGENCPELKESEDEKIRKELLEHCRKQAEMYNTLQTGKEYGKVQSWITWLEKQGQKEKDILEDAILDGNEVGKDFTSSRFLDDNKIHLWTIQDAKDGDVLVNWNNTVFIFKTIEDETVKFHVAYNEKWDTIKTPSTKLSHLGFPEPQFEFHPATKEQCTELFVKMYEAGYMWDTESKQLSYYPKAEPTGKQKSAWSEEDDQYVEDIISLLDFGGSIHTKEQVQDWLKSIKQRYT